MKTRVIGLLLCVVATALPIVGATARAATASANTEISAQRIAGADRIETAVKVSQSSFPDPGTAQVVVLARSDAFADALVGGPLAGELGGPLLLTGSASLAPATATEISRVLPAGGTVFVLGGSAAISSAVDAALSNLGFAPKRLAGKDRFDTAVAVADKLGDPTTIFEATGLSFPDALAGSPAAVAAHAAILLTNGAAQAPETAAYLKAHSPSVRFALGGPAAKADPLATPIAGADRFDTAARVAARFFPSATAVGVATGANFPDALAAGPALAKDAAPLVLVPSTGALPSSVASLLLQEAPSLQRATVFGGLSAVDEIVVGQVDQLASLGLIAKAANVDPAQQDTYGVRVEIKLLADGSAYDLTLVGDAVTGTGTEYRSTGTSDVVANGVITRAVQANMPTGGQALKDYIVAAYGTPSGFDANDAFVRGAEQVVLDPVIQPTLRLATYALLAGLPGATVSDVGGVVNGKVAAMVSVPFHQTGGRLVLWLDPDTGMPLRDGLYTSDGASLGISVYQSFSRTNTAPPNPYA